MVMWKPTGSIQRLAARSTPSTIAPGQSKALLVLSAILATTVEQVSIRGDF